MGSLRDRFADGDRGHGRRDARRESLPSTLWLRSLRSDERERGLRGMLRRWAVVSFGGYDNEREQHPRRSLLTEYITGYGI